MMPFIAPDFSLATPEIFLLTMVSAILVVDVYVPARWRDLTYWLTQASLVATAILVIVIAPSSPAVTFNGTFVSDGMSTVLKVFMLLFSYFALFYMRAYLAARDLLKGEYFILALFAVLGMMVLVSAHNFLTVYLGLELLSLSLYAMVALHRDSKTAAESAMKYFVLGALASGMLLYGISMLYGVTGTLDLAEVSAYVAAQTEQDLVLVLGLVFVIVGVAFKLGAAPFHMWVPDVYEGAPTPVTLFIGTAPKLAAFAMLMRLLVDGLSGLEADWTQILSIMAFLSIAVGNIIAIAQSNIKRMLAYSTVAHAGFLFLGIVAGTPDGYAASMFYIIAYALMAMGAFAMIIFLSRAGFEADRLEDFRGLHERSPWYALLMMVLMLSMAGVPPFLGFWAKWYVLLQLVSSGVIWLAASAVLFSVVGLYYYLRVVWFMYFEEAVDETTIAWGSDMRVMVSVNALAVLALGLLPGALMALCIGALAA